MSIFDNLVGQEAAVAELSRAARAARAIRDGSVRGGGSGQGEESALAMSQAWLFTGPPGSGRSLAALALAGALECTGDEPGCGECPSCKAVLANNHPDVSLITTDVVTITAEQVREYVARSFVAPSTGDWRVLIIEDADRMLTRTTNVLLKAIEEPGPRTVWMLCTAAAADVLPTIRSRCRNINLVTPSAEVVAGLLERVDGVEPSRAIVAARAAQSHIGLARALATDPQAIAIRSNTLNALVKIKGVGDAAMAAQILTDIDRMRGLATDAKSKKANAEEAERIEERKRMEALGLDPDAKIPAHVRSQIKGSADTAKRRETRQNRDILDRELLYMLSFYRDVLALQVGSSVDLINVDYEAALTDIAASTTTAKTLARIDAISEGRTRLSSNVPPVLVMESVLVALR